MRGVRMRSPGRRRKDVFSWPERIWRPSAVPSKEIAHCAGQPTARVKPPWYVDLLNLNLKERVSYDADRNILFLNLEGYNIRTR
jgi:hypothetical protein